MAAVISVCVAVFGGAWLGETFISHEWSYYQWVIVLALIRLLIIAVEYTTKKD
jgi:anaerobic C4-dicarboxylate transporter